MKLKQSLSLNKKIYLPQLRSIQSNKITPKNKSNNHSLPKILALNFGNIDSRESNNHHRNLLQERRPLKDRLKALYNRKRENLRINTIQTETNPKAIEQADITNRFQREIEKNLAHIKRVKQSNRKQINKKPSLKERYHSTKINKEFSQELQHDHINWMRSGTQETVLSTINQIIMNSKVKTLPADQEVSLSPKSYLIDAKNSRQYVHQRKRIHTDAPQLQHIKHRARIKHNQNYQQWRKLSIDSLSNASPRYENSSFQIETDRLENIRSKNDLSLRKYIEGKDYLQKLINLRQSSMAERKE